MVGEFIETHLAFKMTELHMKSQNMKKKKKNAIKLICCYQYFPNQS